MPDDNDILKTAALWLVATDPKGLQPMGRESARKMVGVLRDALKAERAQAASSDDREPRPDPWLTQVAALHRAIRSALNELGVPGPGYPAPVANAVTILNEALGGAAPSAPPTEEQPQ